LDRDNKRGPSKKKQGLFLFIVKLLISPRGRQGEGKDSKRQKKKAFLQILISRKVSSHRYSISCLDIIIASIIIKRPEGGEAAHQGTELIMCIVCCSRRRNKDSPRGHSR
jgi:hypothetical protein